MAMTISIDDALKDDFTAVCKEIGLTPSAAIGVFAKTVVREQAIPFELSSVSRDERRTRAAEAEISQAVASGYASYLAGDYMTRTEYNAARAS